MKWDSFTELHPAVTGLYFAVVIGITMCVPAPGLLAVSFVSAAAYLLRLKGRRGGRMILLGVLPAAIAAALINAAFNHEGATILCYLPDGNPLTLESVLYGLNASVMLAAAALWFGCVTAVMTSEKIVCIFGKVLPSLGLLISMMLRFLPRFTEMLRETGEARRGLGVTDRDRKGGKTTKLRDAVGNMSAVFGRALENSADTADSMRARGWGLPGRGSFYPKRFTERDRGAAAFIAFCGFSVVSGALAGGFGFRFYPTIKASERGPLTVFFLAMFAALGFMPTVLGAKKTTAEEKND